MPDRPNPLHPRFWVVHLLALVLLAAAGALGWWQFAGWQAKRAAEARDLTLIDPLPLAEVMGPDDAFPGKYVGQPVELSGSWVPEGTVLVSGRERSDVEGYWVVTPVSVGPDDAAIMVVRGWTDRPDEAPAPPSGPAELVAWLQPAEGTGVVDDDPACTARTRSPRIRRPASSGPSWTSCRPRRASPRSATCSTRSSGGSSAGSWSSCGGAGCATTYSLTRPVRTTRTLPVA